MCENEAVNGVTRDGGYAEYVLLRTEAVVRVPTDVDPVEYAPILCAGITVFNSIRKQNITLGELVAIQGLGGLGHLAVQCELLLRTLLLRMVESNILQTRTKWGIKLLLSVAEMTKEILLLNSVPMNTSTLRRVMSMRNYRQWVELLSSLPQLLIRRLLDL